MAGSSRRFLPRVRTQLADAAPPSGMLSNQETNMTEREADWARQPGSDSRSRVKAPDDAPVTRPPNARPDAPALVLALESHIATLKTDIERLTAELAGERAARQADQEQYQEQLVAERAARQADRAADKATAELVELARRLAEIAEKQPSKTEPQRRSAVGRAWRWFLRN
jgi:hypothetical protein